MPSTGRVTQEPKQDPVDSTPSDPVQTALRAQANELIREVLLLPDSQAVEGKELSLASVVGDAGADQRLSNIKTYWQSVIAIADYHFALKEQEELQGFDTSIDKVTESEVRSATASASARTKDRLLAARLMQEELGRLGGIGSREVALPVDVPYIGRYRTNYEKLLDTRALSVEMKRVHLALPMMLDVILARADSVRAQEERYATLKRAATQGQGMVEHALAAHRDLREERRAFLDAVLEYNEMIADYAISVAPSSTSRTGVVSMLINSKSTGVARRSNGTSLPLNK